MTTGSELFPLSKAINIAAKPENAATERDLELAKNKLSEYEELSRKYNYEEAARGWAILRSWVEDYQDREDEPPEGEDYPLADDPSLTEDFATDPGDLQDAQEKYID